MVHSFGYRYRLHRGTLAGKPDLVFPARRMVIDVDGCIWYRYTFTTGRLSQGADTITGYGL